MVHLNFVLVIRGSFPDFSETELHCLQYVHEGLALLNGKEFHYYRIEIPTNTFESLREINSYPTNADLWDDWIRMIQVLIHDLLALLPYEKVVIDIQLEDWLGLRNCVGVVWTRDHDLCDFDNNLGEHCDHIYDIMLPPSITNTPAVNVWTPQLC